MTASALVRRPWIEPTLVIIAAALLISALSTGVDSPSFWYDEVATLSGARRPLSSLVDMTQNVDAVHGLYYAMMHGVLRLFGSAEVAMRLPSVIATALSAVGIYALARLYQARTIGIVAGLLFAVLPRSTWMSTEARSFALAALASVAMSILFAIIVRRPSWWSIAAYSIATTFAVHLFMYLALVAVAHALFALTARPRPKLALGVVAGLAFAAAASLPHLLRVLGQRGQLGGTYPLDERTVERVLVTEYFMESGTMAVVLWILVALSAIAVLWQRRDIVGPPLALSGAWLLVPHIAVMAYSAVAPTIYQPRAFVICAPAFCLLTAQLLVSAFGRWWASAAVVCLAVLAVPSFLAERAPTAKGTDWRAAAMAIDEMAIPSDIILYLPPDDVHSYNALLPLAYPDHLTQPRDPALVVPAVNRPFLFDERRELTELGDQLAGSRVLLVANDGNSPSNLQSTLAFLGNLGFHTTAAETLPKTTIHVLERDHQPPA